MSFRITTNVSTLQAGNRLFRANENFAKTTRKISSGTRINIAADDAAGLAISEHLRASIKSLGMARKNNADGISIVQVAEGSLSGISEALIRMRELAMQAASDSYTDAQRTMAHLEAKQLEVEIDRVANGTKWAGNKLIAGNGNSYEFQVGIYNDSSSDRIAFVPSENNATVDALGVDGVDYRDKFGAQSALAKIDKAITSVNNMRANLGSIQNRLVHSLTNVDVSKENVTTTESRVRDTDMAFELANQAKENVLADAAVATHAQANQKSNNAMALLG